MGQRRGPVVTCVLLCPGQGAQKVGMGRDLADRFPAAGEVFRAVDDALNTRLSQIMWEGPEDELTRTHNAQPAILAHTLAVHAVVASSVAPVAAAGHSLGEYSAYAAAGALSIVEAARLVRTRGELMLRAGEQRAGTMAAVIGLDADAVGDVCDRASEAGEVVVAANINAPDQVVISGDPAAVDRAGALLKAAGAKRVLPLKVSGAFHSPLMAPAQEDLRRALSEVAMSAPAFPIIANATAEPTEDAREAARLLGDQLTHPVRWVASMRRAAAMAGPDTPFVEIGPGNVLGGLLKRILPDAKTRALGSADQIDAFLEETAGAT